MTHDLGTAAVPARERFAYWHEVICRVFVGLDASPLPSERGFAARLRGSALGAVEVSTVTARPHRVQRSAARVEQDGRDDFLVSVQVRGASVVRQDGREARLRPGDLALYDSSRPYELVMPDDFSLVVLQMPREVLLDRFPAAAQCTAVRVDGDAGAGACVSAFLRSLDAAFGLSRGWEGMGVGGSAVELLALALASGWDAAGTSTASGHLARAEAYLGAHLADAELTPARLAAAIGLSNRRLQELYQATGTSVGRRLLDRRLERADADLRNPALRDRSVAAIATASGFKSVSHFTRRYVERYGVTPSRARPPRTAPAHR